MKARMTRNGMSQLARPCVFMARDCMRIPPHYFPARACEIGPALSGQDAERRMILVVRRAAEYFHHIRIISLAELFAACAFASAIAVIVGGPFRIVLFKPALHAASIAAPLISGALALVI